MRLKVFGSFFLNFEVSRPRARKRERERIRQTHFFLLFFFFFSLFFLPPPTPTHNPHTGALVNPVAAARYAAYLKAHPELTSREGVLVAGETVLEQLGSPAASAAASSARKARRKARYEAARSAELAAQKQREASGGSGSGIGIGGGGGGVKSSPLRALLLPRALRTATRPWGSSPALSPRPCREPPREARSPPRPRQTSALPRSTRALSPWSLRGPSPGRAPRR